MAVDLSDGFHFFYIKLSNFEIRKPLNKQCGAKKIMKN